MVNSHENGQVPLRLLSRREIYAARTPDEVSVFNDKLITRGGKSFDYIHLHCPYEVVHVLPIRHSGEVALIRHYRHTLESWIWEIPAGSANKGESNEDAAQRELLEETGLHTIKLKHLTSFYPSAGITNQLGHVYAALVSDKLAVSPGSDDAEPITLHWLSMEQALAMIVTGELAHAGAMIGLSLLSMSAETASANLTHASFDSSI